MLELSRVTFGYQPNQLILKDVSLFIGSGEFVAVAGRNGAGKTTVTRLMMALGKPLFGKVVVNGADVAKATPAVLARHIGYVFQNPDRQMFRDTVASEVAYGPEQLGFSPVECQAAVEQALTLTGLTQLADAYPMTLSKGQKQRVAIATALAAGPKVLILDEPTSGQDCRQRRQLMELLARLHKQGLTIVLVTHDMELIAQYAQRVVVIAEGKVAFDGKPQHLFDGTQPLGEWGLESTGAVISREIMANCDTIYAAMSSKTAPLTKLLFTVAVSLWSILLSTIPALAALVGAQLVLLALAGTLGRTAKGLGALAVFATILAGLQYALGGGVELAIITALRMLSMAVVFLLLLSTTSLQHLTAALVRQCHVPHEYAFMFTSALRFVPDFLAESRAVREAQACRGYEARGNLLKRFISYVALVEPLVLRAVTRSETMALSLALRGFGSKNRSFSANVALGGRDYGMLAGMGLITVGIVYLKVS